MTDKQFDECIKQICAGNKDGLRQIYEAYLPYIFSLVLGILKNREDAEDITSSFFLKLWNTAEQYRSGHGHKTYITAIARNLCYDHLRKQSREVIMDLSGQDEETENLIFEGHSPGFEEETAERLSLKEALKTLKDSEREIIHLKIAGEMTFNEISEILKIPIGTVSWRYREAIKKLRRYGYE